MEGLVEARRKFSKKTSVSPRRELHSVSLEPRKGHLLEILAVVGRQVQLKVKVDFRKKICIWTLEAQEAKMVFTQGPDGALV